MGVRRTINRWAVVALAIGLITTALLIGAATCTAAPAGARSVVRPAYRALLRGMPADHLSARR